jgi:Fic family protein
MDKQLNLISSWFYQAYLEACPISLPDAFQKLRVKSAFTAEDFEYYLINASLYSSKIEGNTLDVNSFFRNRGSKTTPKQKEVQEIEDLTAAYKFAAENRLNKANFMKAHAMLSQTFLPAKERGKIRKEMVGVRDAQTMRPVYLAVEPQFVKEELNRLFEDIAVLLKEELDILQTFYYASMIHLWIAKIHPFTDGNGRAARLLEKWFMASVLGLAAWSIRTEQYYWDNRPAYYQNIALGYNYYALHWERCIPFLLMLPHALKETIA